MSKVPVSCNGTGTRKYKSRPTPKDYKTNSSAILHSKQIAKPLLLTYCNNALSLEHIPAPAIRQNRCSLSNASLNKACSDVSDIDIFSEVVEDAVRRVVHGSLQDLHQDIGTIQRTLSQIGNSNIVMQKLFCLICSKMLMYTFFSR